MIPMKVASASKGECFMLIELDAYTNLTDKDFTDDTLK